MEIMAMIWRSRHHYMSSALKMQYRRRSSFWTKYSLETSYDYTYLEISTDGINWTEMESFNGTVNSWLQKTFHSIAILVNQMSQSGSGLQVMILLLKTGCSLMILSWL